jgi:hypothetical protein
LSFPEIRLHRLEGACGILRFLPGLFSFSTSLP